MSQVAQWRASLKRRGRASPSTRSSTCPSPWRSAASSESTIRWRCPCSTATRSSTTWITPSSGCRRASSIRTRLATLQHPPESGLLEGLAHDAGPHLPTDPVRERHEGGPALGGADERLEDRRRRVAPHRLAALPAVQRGRAGVERAQVVGDRGHGADRRARGADGRGAVHRHRRAARPRSARPAAGRAARGTAARRGRRSRRSAGGPRRRARRRRATTCRPPPRRSPR